MSKATFHINIVCDNQHARKPKDVSICSSLQGPGNTVLKNRVGSSRLLTPKPNQNKFLKYLKSH